MVNVGSGPRKHWPAIVREPGKERKSVQGAIMSRLLLWALWGDHMEHTSKFIVVPIRQRLAHSRCSETCSTLPPHCHYLYAYLLYEFKGLWRGCWSMFTFRAEHGAVYKSGIRSRFCQRSEGRTSRTFRGTVGPGCAYKKEGVSAPGELRSFLRLWGKDTGEDTGEG